MVSLSDDHSTTTGRSLVEYADRVHSWPTERIRRVLEAQRGGRGPVATASFGVTEAVVGDDVSSLVRRADDAMRLAKREGRNRVVSQAA